MTINVRVRDGMCPDPTTGEGGATEGDIRGSFSDIIDVVGVKDLAGGHALVTQNSPAALSVLVAPGVVYIPNADYDELDSNQVKFWEAVITVSTAVTITANTSGSARVDLICAKMDTTITPDEHASNIATLVAIAGTPGAGAPATPDNHSVLAQVSVANGADTIVTGNITDKRVQSKIDFHYLPKATGAEVNTGISETVIVTPKAIADSKLADYIRGDGWISANESWTYASAATITVPSGAASKYKVGDKIKWTQTTVKNAYVIKVENTLLTVAGDAVLGAAITNNYYSHAENPIEFPNKFLYTPVWTLTSGTLNTTYINQSGYFYIHGGILTFYWYFRLNVVSTATGSKAFEVSPPIDTTLMDNSFLSSTGVCGIGNFWDNLGGLQTTGMMLYYTTNKFRMIKEVGANNVCVGTDPDITLATGDRWHGQVTIPLL